MSVDDKRSPDLERLLEDLDIEISVGIHAEEGAADHDGLTTAEVGAIHEFGLGVPQRSFIRGYFDEHQGEIEQLQAAALERVIAGADPRIEAGRLGLLVEGGIKQRILSRIDPPLAESTRKRRGDDAVPLVDTSQLLGAIRSRVTEKK